MLCDDSLCYDGEYGGGRKLAATVRTEVVCDKA